MINKYSNSDKQVLSIVIIVINSDNSDKQVGLYSGGLIFGGGGGAYIWNEVSVSTCGGLIHRGGLYSGGGLIFGGLIFGGLRYTVQLPEKYKQNFDVSSEGVTTE